MVTSKRIPLHEPSFDLEDGMNLLDTLRTTWVSTGGPYVEKFEKDFADYVGTKFAISVCNGTIAIQLLLESLKKSRGIEGEFEVIVPTLTFIATAAAVVHAQGVPIFVDNSPDSFNMSVSAVESHILEQYTRPSGASHWISRSTQRPLLAVMSVHIMGWPGEMSALKSLCERLDIPYIEDAAESLGSRDKNNAHLGSQSLASTFSFNGNKILTTGGGGMIATNDPLIAKFAKHLSTTAKTDSLRYTHDSIGHNFRLVNILAALGCSQLHKLDERLEQKRTIFQKYKSLLGTKPGLKIYEEPASKQNNWLNNVIFDTEAHRERALAALIKQGIEARPLWTPLHLQEAFVKHSQYRLSFAHAEFYWKHTLSLPSSPGLSDSDISRICDIILLPE